MRNTKIDWADVTWNPLSGCLNNCEYCYARKIARRFGGNENGGFHVVESCGEAYPFGFDPTFFRHRLNEPVKRKSPSNIFVCSMADLFGDWVPENIIEEVLDATREAPQHRYLFLTKNPRRYLALAEKLPFGENYWYGTTVTARDDPFLYGFSHNTFISIEPIKGNVFHKGEITGGIDWVIVGAETGNRKGRVAPKKDWIDNIVSVCENSGIPIFMKDSLVSIVGEEGVKREFPSALRR